MRIIAEDAEPQYPPPGRGPPGRTTGPGRAATRLRAAQVALLASLGMAEVPVATAAPRRHHHHRLGAGRSGRAPRARAGSTTAIPIPWPPSSGKPGPSRWSWAGVADNAAATVEAIACRPGEMRCPDPFRRRLGRRFRLRAGGHESGRLHPALRKDRRAARHAHGLRQPRGQDRLRPAGQSGLHLRDLRGLHQAPAAAPAGACLPPAAAAGRAGRRLPAARTAERTAFVPVICREGRAELVSYHGSAHLHALSQANALLRVPAGMKRHRGREHRRCSIPITARSITCASR